MMPDMIDSYYGPVLPDEPEDCDHDRKLMRLEIGAKLYHRFLEIANKHWDLSKKEVQCIARFCAEDNYIDDAVGMLRLDSPDLETVFFKNMDFIFSCC